MTVASYHFYFDNYHDRSCYQKSRTHLSETLNNQIRRHTIAILLDATMLERPTSQHCNPEPDRHTETMRAHKQIYTCTHVQLGNATNDELRATKTHTKVTQTLVSGPRQY